jgi:hypothetical protein
MQRTASRRGITGPRGGARALRIGERPGVVEPLRTRHVDHRDRYKAPQEQDARERRARAGAFQDQVARHFAQRVADKKHTRAQSVHRVAEAEVLLHLQLREADIGAVEVRDHIAQKKEGKQPPGGFPVGALRGVGIDVRRRAAGYGGTAQARLRHGIARWGERRQCI